MLLYVIIFTKRHLHNRTLGPNPLQRFGTHLLQHGANLHEVQERLVDIKEDFRRAGITAFSISAATGEGVSELMAEAMKVLQAVAAGVNGARLSKKVFRPVPKDAGVMVRKVGDAFILSVPELERIMAGAGVSMSELRWQLNSQLTRLGVNKALKKAGVKLGDRIRCGSLEWEW